MPPPVPKSGPAGAGRKSIDHVVTSFDEKDKIMAAIERRKKNERQQSNQQEDAIVAHF
jgi:hypothetical protein